MHTFERILAKSHAGDYSHKCEVAGQLRKYESIRAQNLRARRYVDVAYIEGYMNGLMYLIADDEGHAQLPFYFIYGLDGQPATLTEYKKALRTPGITHNRAKALADRIVREKLGPGDDVHHTPFLTWEGESE